MLLLIISMLLSVLRSNVRVEMISVVGVVMSVVGVEMRIVVLNEWIRDLTVWAIAIVDFGRRRRREVLLRIWRGSRSE